MNHTKTLDKWRKFKGVSIEELAKKSGLTVSTIYRMEQNGLVKRNFETILAYVDALDISISDVDFSKDMKAYRGEKKQKEKAKRFHDPWMM